MKNYLLVCILLVAPLRSADGFEGILFYSVTSRVGENVSESKVKYLIKDGIVRQEGEGYDHGIHVVQFDSVSGKKTTAWLDKWTVSEVDINDYDESSTLFHELGDSNIAVNVGKEEFGLVSADGRFEFHVNLGEPKIESDFLEFFELVRFATKVEKMDRLYIPKEFFYKIGNLKFELKLMATEERQLEMSLFKLPPALEESDGADIFVPKRS